jgi:hypothetical protein
MQLRRVLIPLVVAGVGVLGVQGTASAHNNNRQNFVIVDDFAEDDIATVLGFGNVFSLVGEDTTISETEDLFTFPDGTITVHHARTGEGNERFNPRTCRFSFSERGVYVLAEGTDAYEGVTGSGRYHVRGQGSSPKNPDGSCSEEATGTIIITLRGTVNPAENGV